MCRSETSNTHIDDFLAAMTKNGFVVVKRNENMSGYPLFGFKKSRS